MNIAEQIARVTAHRDRTLARRPVADVIEALAAVADVWRQPNSKWLARAAKEGPAATGFSPEMIRLGLRDFFEDVNRSTLSAWVYGEIGSGLDGWQARQKPPGIAGGNPCAVKYLLVGPGVVAHIFPGNLANAALQSMLCGLLVKAANVCKCGSGDPLLPRLFAQSLIEVDEDLGRCVMFLDWKGGDEAVEREVWGVSDAVMVNGSDEAVESVRRRIPSHVRLLGYGHRVSVAFAARESLTGETLPQLAEAAAYDVSVWDQQGCLSPHCIYVEEGGAVSALEFAEALATEMGRFEEKYPRGRMSDEEAASFMRVRGAYEFRAGADNRVRVFGEGQERPWSVIYEEEPMWATSCLNRLVFVKPVRQLEDLPRYLGMVRGKLLCVGMASDAGRWETLAEMAAGLGVSRVCPLGRMQRPLPCWHHNGRGTLSELVRWVDGETLRR